MVPDMRISIMLAEGRRLLYNNLVVLRGLFRYDLHKLNGVRLLAVNRFIV